MKIGLACCDCEREVDDAEPYALRCWDCERKMGAEIARLTGEDAPHQEDLWTRSA